MTKIKVLPLIAAGIVLATSSSMFAAPELAATRSTLKEWVQLKKLVSEENSKWRVEKETLNESIDLLTKEIDKLDERVQTMQQDADAAQLERQSLNNEEEQLKQAAAVVNEIASDLERDILQLVELFPNSLRDKLKLLTERIPKTPRAADQLGLSTRIQYVIGILGEIEKFNKQISVEETMQRIGDSDVAVKTMYIGLAVGYYVDGTRKEAGILTPARDGWVKESRNELAEDIAMAIAIYEREETAKFVNLPFSVN
jgi:FtsZ-binding cell division protein ZapB